MIAGHVLERGKFSGPLPQYSDSLKLCNSEGHIYFLSDMLCNVGMKTVGEIRRDNLQLAIKDAGSAAALAEKAGISSVYLSQIKNQAPEAKTGKPKTMGDDVARKIEKGLSLANGWMDADHHVSIAELPTLVDERIVEPEDIAVLFRLFMESTANGRKKILDAADLAPKSEKRSHSRVTGSNGN
jgi:hypothetical protein